MDAGAVRGVLDVDPGDAVVRGVADAVGGADDERAVGGPEEIGDRGFPELGDARVLPGAAGVVGAPEAVGAGGEDGVDARGVEPDEGERRAAVPLAGGEVGREDGGVLDRGVVELRDLRGLDGLGVGGVRGGGGVEILEALVERLVAARLGLEQELLVVGDLVLGEAADGPNDVVPAAALVLGEPDAEPRGRPRVRAVAQVALTRDPLALASALRKIHMGAQRRPLPAEGQLTSTAHLMIANPFKGGGVAALFATHPPMEQRVARLERLAAQLGPVRHQR
ncbi:MAG: hypothetical protein ACK4YP_23335 [Myxococcota bacterium]